MAIRPILVSAPMTPWSLDPQLERDTVTLGDLPLSRVLLNNNANYPWLILVPRRPAIVELIDLAEADQARLLSEITQTAGALRTITKCDKLNIGALGNIVRQLHVHIIARFFIDPAWPQPVWGRATPRPYDPQSLAQTRNTLRQAIGLN